MRRLVKKVKLAILDGQPAPKDFVADVAILKKLSRKKLKRITEEMILIFPSGSLDSESRQTLLEETKIPHGDFNKIQRAISFVLFNTGKRRLSPSILEGDLKELGVSNDRANILSDAWKSHSQDMIQKLFSLSMSSPTIGDVSWKIVTYNDSAYLRDVNIPLILLNLTISDRNTTRSIALELSLRQFQILRSTLNEITKTLAMLGVG